MRTWIKQSLIGGVLVVMSVASTATVMSRPDPSTMPEMTEAELQAMSRWMEFMTPGEHHAELAKCEGEWNVEMRYWMNQGDEPQVNKVRSTAKMVMGGRYLVEKIEGMISMGGPAPVPFEGMSITAFDNNTGEWRTVWIDNFGTGLWTERGAALDGKDIWMETKGNNFDPMSGEEKQTMTRVRWIDADTKVMEFHGASPGEEMWKGMEIHYSRRK